MKFRLLIVDDEPLILDLITGVFPSSQYDVLCANCGRQALEILEHNQVDIAILDYSLPDLCGAELFHQIRAELPKLPVVFLTGYANLETAVSLMKAGACDYLTKPFNLAELRTYIGKILKEGSDSLQKQPTDPSAPAISAPGKFIFGNSPAMQNVEAQVHNLQRYPDTTVLITGPTGTGKSVVARRIHEFTFGDTAPFVEIDCSTIPRELCESELFGHEKGAFTGAHRAQKGLFEAAGHGTAFLDEIGELDLALQAKFLRVLEARRFKRVGGHTTLQMHARVIAATNRSLPELVRAGRFREDLFYRLNVFELWMPALKERGEDVLTLARHFLQHFAERYQKPIVNFAPDAMDYLVHCDFPGNVRQLRNMIERAVINTHGTRIHFSQLVALSQDRTGLQSATARALPANPGPAIPSPHRIENRLTAPAPTTMNLADIEKQKLTEALLAARGNKSQAAKIVGLSRTAFHRRLQKHGVATAN